MTDSFNALTVSLSRDIRDDDAEVIINAIKMIRGVEDVTGNIVDHDSYVVESRYKSKLISTLTKFISEL